MRAAHGLVGHMSYLETLQRVRHGHWEHAPEAEKDAAIREVIKGCSIAASAVAVQPIPLLDTALVSPIQIRMMRAIGRVHGYEVDRKSIGEILGSFRTSLVEKNAIMAAAKLVPFAGWIVTTRIAWVLTHAIGEVSDHYFRHGRSVPKHELERLFKRIYEQREREKKPASEDQSGSSDRRRRRS